MAMNCLSSLIQNYCKGKTTWTENCSWQELELRVGVDYKETVRRAFGG